MNINKICKFVISVSMAFMLVACSTSPNKPSANGEHESVSLVVPSLQVKSDCGKCKIRNNIASLIIDGYNKAAINAGAKISSKSNAIITIKEYVERGDTERFLAGAFAGKDEIKASITYQGKDYFVEDYYRNAWLGIETLATKIGELTFEKMHKKA